MFCLALFPAFPAVAEPVALGDHLELFADDFIVGETSGDLERHLHRPEPKEVVLTADAPWEGNTSGYYTLFQDGDLYRMIYRGWAHDPETKKQLRAEVTCYAESDDGIHWRKPNLGLFEWEGSKDNNIIIRSGNGIHNFTAFKDSNPDCPPEARYKALGGSKEKGKHGLMYFRSADCIHWEQVGEEPVITEGAFDSQNLAFWDSERGEYRAHWRIFTEGVVNEKQWKPGGYRAIRTAASKDFVHWEPHHDLAYPEGTPNQHLYTNAVQPYFRAPQILIGFPTRYLPDEGQRVEPIFMISRDGVNFRRFNEPVIPESAPADRQGNRSNYMTWGMLRLPGKPDEISVYATEAYYGPVPGRVRRFAYRLDGFVSMRTGNDGGELLTKPLTFSGNHLTLNYTTLAKRGSVKIELQNADGQPIDGFTLADATPLTGDSVKATVTWKGGHDLSELSGKPVRVRLVATQADLFSLRFH
ncbi:MAG: hypothetical protein KDN19_13585 [Verrucomicrobiae bacterium]|nr:hypothetical protein [Verrucomicrobiae bacterium]